MLQDWNNLPESVTEQTLTSSMNQISKCSRGCSGVSIASSYWRLGASRWGRTGLRSTWGWRIRPAACRVIGSVLLLGACTTKYRTFFCLRPGRRCVWRQLPRPSAEMRREPPASCRSGHNPTNASSRAHHRSKKSLGYWKRHRIDAEATLGGTYLDYFPTEYPQFVRIDRSVYKKLACAFGQPVMCLGGLLRSKAGASWPVRRGQRFNIRLLRFLSLCNV